MYLSNENYNSKTEKINNFLKLNSHKFLYFFIAINTIIIFAFFILYFLGNSSIKHTINYKLYVVSIVFIFTCFKIHFAYHSVRINIIFYILIRYQVHMY